VKGGDAQTTTLFAFDEFANPLLHLTRRLIGKGDGGDLMGGDTAILDQVGNLAGDYPRFATTCASENQQWSIDVAHRLILTGVEGHGSP